MTGVVSYLLYGGGRLGNTMHQIAAAYAYARKHNMPYIIPRDIWGYHLNWPKINYAEQDVIDAHKATARIIKEPTSQVYFDIPPPTNENENILIDGYMQCFKYCDEYRNEILDLFGFNYALNKGVVSIHVRRGDYVKHQYSFPLCTAEYYKMAMAEFIESGYKEFLVFGEDAETYNWFRANIKGLNCNITYSPIGTPFADMMRQSCCEHNIIANSTFSVWAAWANRNPNKVVAAPNKLTNWYSIRGVDSKDVYPDDWVQISFKPQKQ